MSSFDTPQRQFVDTTKIENQYVAMTPEISSLVDKLQEANFTPSKRIPLGLMFENNRGVLASGAQRVLVKEKELVKTPKSASRGKTNFMKPTEAYRNGHVPMTTPSKSPKTVSAPMSGPHVTPSTRITAPSSGSATKKNSASSPAIVPKSHSTQHTPSSSVPQHHVLETPLRTNDKPRSTSTPPSTRRPLASAASSGGTSSNRKTPEDPAVKRRMESPKRVPSTSHNILFSPPRAGQPRALDDTVLSGAGDASLLLHSTPQRAQSNPRPSRHSEADHHAAHEPTVPSKKPAVPVFDLRVKKNSTPAAPSTTTEAVEKRKAPVPHQQAPSSHKTNDAPSGLSPAAASVGAAVKSSGPARFKNPAPSSVLVTTADTLSANKAAKKAVHASLFKPPALHVSHYYTPPPPPPAVAAAPAPAGSVGGSASTALSGPSTSGTPSRKAKSTATSDASPEAAAIASEEASPPASRPSLTHKSGSTNSLFGSSPPQSTLTAPTVSSAKKAKKTKKVTISGNSPTILSSASVLPLQPPAPPVPNHLTKPYKQGDLNVDAVLNTLTFSGTSAAAESEHDHTEGANNDHSRLSTQSPHHALDYLSDIHRSMSFGSELSSLRGHPADADVSIADTIDLSNNTSSIMIHDHSCPSPFEPHLLPSGTPISAITHASTGTNAARRSQARLELDENLLNVSAVEPAMSYSPSQHSGLVSFGSLSAFTPIPPNQQLTQQQLMVSARSRPSRHHHNTATVTSRSSEYTNFYAQYSEGNYAYGGVPALARSSSNNHPAAVGPFRKSTSTSSAALSPLTPHSTAGGAPFSVSRQTSLNNTSFMTMEEEGEEGSSVASSNVLNRGMMMMSTSCSVASDFNAVNGGDLMLNISGCGSLASYSVAPVTPSNALNTAMMMMSQSRSDGSPLKIELSNSILSGTSTMLNTLASAHNVLNTGMMESDSPEGSPEKDLTVASAGNRMQCFSSDSLSEIPSVTATAADVPIAGVESADATLSRLDHLHLSDYVRPDGAFCDSSYLEGPNSCTSRGGMLNRTITLNPQDIHCVELEGESELLDETEDEEVEPVFIVDMTSTAVLGQPHSASAPFEVADNKNSSHSADVPNFTFSHTSESEVVAMGTGGSMDDSMNQALDFVENLVVLQNESSGLFLPHQVDSNSSNSNNADATEEPLPSFEFSEQASEDSDMVMLSDHEEQEEEQPTLSNNDEEEDEEEPPGPPPLEEADFLLLPPRAYSGEDEAMPAFEEASGLEESFSAPRRSACSPVSLPPLGIALPTRTSESFEFKPRSLSALPVPASLMSPVTKSYLDIERTLRNQHSASPRKVSTHLDFESYRGMESDSMDRVLCGVAGEQQLEEVQEEEEEEEFVSTLPHVRSQLPPSQVVYQQDSLDLSRSVGQPHANTSLISINTSGYNSSLCSNTSSVDELQRVNPRAKSGQWVSHHYRSPAASGLGLAVPPSGSAVPVSSSALKAGKAEPMSLDEFDHSSSDMKPFHPREDISTLTMCPDPVARQLSDEVAAVPSVDERDFKPVSGYFKLH